MESEFSKSFQKQMQSYLTNNKTALVLDEWQKQVSGKGPGRGTAGMEGSHLWIDWAAVLAPLLILLV